MASDVEGTKAKFDAKGLPERCEVCGADTTWVIDQDRYALVKLNPDGALTHKALPLAPMICQACGHVRIFHADML